MSKVYTYVSWLTSCWLWSVALCLGCYDEVRPPLCFEPPDALPVRPENLDLDAFRSIYLENERSCISRASVDEPFDISECEGLWFGAVEDGERARRYEVSPRLLSLQAIPVEGAPLYARCLPLCTPETCDCESHDDCGEGERCLGPRLRGDEPEDGVWSFCVPACSASQQASCQDAAQAPYCELEGGERCYPIEQAPECVYEAQTPITDEEYSPLSLVDPMVATGGLIAEIASVTPGASAPNGMTMVGPDTRTLGGMAPPFHCAGYHYPDTHLQGFSHTHAHGMGVVDYGGISVMPRAEWRPEYLSFAGRMAPFDHAAESASPGEYSVVLQDDQTAVQIVATPHGAQHSYTFAPNPSSDADHVVIIDLGDNLINTQTTSAQLEASREEVTAIQVLDGAYSGRFGGAIHHAVLRFDPAPSSYAVWSDDGELTEGEAVTGRTAGLVARFPSTTQRVDLTVGLSYVDLEGAQRNLEAELPDFDYDARRAEVRALWREALSTVKVRSSNEEDVRRFATAHYHSLLMPSLNSDVDGRYRGLDQEVHQLPEGERYYSDLSLWDTFRTLHSFYLLAHPRLQRDVLKSLIHMVEDGGSLPRWPLAHGYTGGMVGTPATQLFTEAYLKGLDGWDAEAGYRAALAQSDNEATQATRGGGEAYDQLGWVPAESQSGSVSKTLEYAWSDDALARLARALGHEEDLDRLDRRAQSWRAHWDPQASEEGGFLVARNGDGSFVPLSDPTSWLEPYVEGSAWHYLWYVPYDVDGMIDVQHGGDKEAFLTRLRAYWEEVKAEEDTLLPDLYYWHGNEPVLHYAWLGSLAGEHALTVEASHHILETRYGHTPEKGLNGNDDSGTLSAWYLLASMGFYPVAGTDEYALGAPIFSRVEVTPEEREGPAWVIESNSNREGGGWYQVPKRVYPMSEVTSETLTAESALPSPTLTHESLTQGVWFCY